MTKMIPEQTIDRYLNIRFYEDISFLMKCGLSENQALDEALNLNQIYTEKLNRKIELKNDT